MKRPSFLPVLIGTGFGSGFSPFAPGTAGALLASIIWIALYFLLPFTALLWTTAALVVLFTFAGIWAANKLESCWGEDPSRVVVDEMVGVWIPLLAVPDNDRWYWYVIAAFALFRIFDIVKPLGVRKMENFKGGVGVMMDDVLAGVYSFILISQKGGVFMFLRAQLSAQMATIADFLVTILLVRLFDVYYVYATLAGAIYGGIINCIINYKWTFKSKGKKTHVAVKFIIVWVCSIWLNTWGTYTLTESLAKIPWVRDTLSQYFGDFFIIPKVVVAVIVALFWNYNMQRFFVYRNIDIRSLFKRN